MNDSTQHAEAAASKFFTFGKADEPFVLQSGEALAPVTLAYETYGTLNAARDNAILLFHALSGSQHAAGFNPCVEGLGERWTEECQIGWWDGFIGPGKALNTDRFFVLCVNYLGGCYGSTGPSSINPATGKPYGSSFPRISFSDIVDSQVHLLDHLGIQTLHAAVGGSLGGTLSINLALRYPERVRQVIPIASGLRVSTLQRVQNLEQILAIEQDPHFNGGNYYDGEPPRQGLCIARIIAHKTYISLHAMEERASHEILQPEEGLHSYRFNDPIESYMYHQGMKFVRRFDANSYRVIMDAWQRFNFLKELGAPTFADLFRRCQGQHYLVFSIDSDVCFYPDDQAELVHVLREAGVSRQHITVHSDKGHDAFLLEPELFTPHLVYMLEQR